jgi:Flp pilus assembly protein TadG
MQSALTEKSWSLARTLSRRFSRSESGIAAVEFAFVVPIMLCMFIGVVELSQAITVDRRVSHVASSTADLVARQRNVTTATLNDYMTIIDQLMAPYSDTPLKLTIASVYNTKAAPTTHLVCWVYHRNDTTASGADTNITAGATYTSLPANILDAGGGTSVIMVKAAYLYQPVLFFNSTATTVQGSKVSSFVGSAGINMTETFYLKPRLQSSVTYNSNNAC